MPLRAVPEDISLENTYGIRSMTAVPVVEITRTKASFKNKE
jgi:hypothetical protein